MTNDDTLEDTAELPESIPLSTRVMSPCKEDINEKQIVSSQQIFNGNDDNSIEEAKQAEIQGSQS